MKLNLLPLILGVLVHQNLLLSQTDTTKVFILEEVTITAKKVLDKISDSQIDSTAIRLFPSHQPYDIFSLAPGIVRRGRDLIVRGGNRNDVDWQFEGISVRDPQTSGYIHSTNINAIDNVSFYLGGLTANTGNARGAIIDLSLKEPTNNYLESSISKGTYNTQLIDAIFSRNFGKFKIMTSGSLMSSDALLLDNRIPLDYDPYSRVLNTENIFPTENNDGNRFNFSTKSIYQINQKSKISFTLSYALEQGKNPPLFHNGKNFSPIEIQDRINSGKLVNADYSSYPFNEKWGGVIDNSTILFSPKFESVIGGKSYLNVQPFAFLTYRYRKDHSGSWFFEQGFGGAYETERHNNQYGVKSDFYRLIKKWYKIKISTELRLTDLDFEGKMSPTIIDSYKNIRGNFYNNEEYTHDAILDTTSSYFGWPEPNTIIKPLSERYTGNFFYFIALVSNNFNISKNIQFNVGVKNSTSNIGKNFNIIDPFALMKIKFLNYFELNTGYSNTTQITSVYQSYSNPYDPYTYGFDANFDAEGNPNINPERANNFEISLKFEKTKISAGITYYYRNTFNDILTTFAPQIVPAYIDDNIAKHYMQYQNLGSGYADGFELKFIAELFHNLKISAFGNFFSRSLTRTREDSPYENSRYSQKNTLNLLLLYQTSRLTTQIHAEYGSGFPYRWREIGVDDNGNPITIRHNYDKFVEPHIVVNGSMSYRIIPNLGLEINFMNIQGLLSPLFHWDKNKYIEYRDTDSTLNPLGIPRFSFYSIQRIDIGLKFRL